MHPSYPRLLSLTLGLAIATASFAQTAAPVADSTSAPAPAVSSAPSAAPAAASGSAPRARRGGTQAPADPLAPPPAWDRPADGPALISDDFESGTLDEKKWTLHVVGKPTITIEQTDVAHGKNAVHVHYPAGTTNKEWAFLGLQIPENLRDHFYGRAYVSVSGIPPTHSVLLLAGSTGFQLADFLEIGVSRSKIFQPSFQLNKPTPDRPRGERVFQMGGLPDKHWFCLEWEFIEKPDRIVIWADGKLVCNRPISYQIVKQGGPTIDSGLTGGFFEFNIGFRTWLSPTKNDVDIYYDDVAIGDKPIGQLTPVPEPAAAPAASSAAQ
jgi:hypothetical protein